MSGNGTWQNSTIGLVWMDLPAVAPGNALLLNLTHRVRYIPDGENGENATLTFVAWDQTSGTNGDLVDALARGGTTAFSLEADELVIQVLNVNQAPVLDAALDHVLTTIDEDAIDNLGQTVASVLDPSGDSITDIDNDALEGIAINATSVDGEGGGHWEYSLDSGGNWSAVEPVDESHALLLRAQDWIRFVPDAINGTTATFTFHAWDQTGPNTTGDRADVTAGTGGTTPFSTVWDNATITVTELNEAPVAPDNATSTPEDTPLPITLEATDADGPAEAVTYGILTPPENGTLTGSAPNLVYAPDDNFTGTDSFTWNATDGHDDSNPATVTITVSPVNDAPVAFDGTVTAEEDTAVAVAVTAVDAEETAGDLTYTIVSGAGHGSLSGTGPAWTYTPDPEFNGTDSFTWNATDVEGASSNDATFTITVLADTDNDGIMDNDDNCPGVQNPGQEDIDADSMGDACDDDPSDGPDGDADGDGLTNGLDNCPAITNSDQADADGDGIGDACDDDVDGDTVPDDVDNCPSDANTDQADADGDGIGDVCDPIADDGPDADVDGDGTPNGSDNCPAVANTNQADVDGDGLGNACDANPNDGPAADADGDGVANGNDNCPGTPNSSQADIDGDGIGNACDGNDADGPAADQDGDGVSNASDNCPATANAEQADADGDGIGNVCDSHTDTDNDGVLQADDNCPLVANADQSDVDGDGVGDVCDDDDADGPSADADADGVANGEDNCPAQANAAQEDTDGDGLGDACDDDPGDGPTSDQDGDGLANTDDNCPTIPNADQSDADDDGTGDACDPFTDSDADGLQDEDDNCLLVANSAQADEDGDGVGDACDASYDLQPDARPTDVQARMDPDGEVNVTWNAGNLTGVTGFRVWRASTPTVVGNVAATAATPYSFMDTEYPGGTHEYYIEPVASSTASSTLETALAGHASRLQIDACPLTSVDTDGDGLCDAQELVLGTSVEHADTDGDGLSDRGELESGADPLTPEQVVAGPDDGNGEPTADSGKGVDWMVVNAIAIGVLLLTGGVAVAIRIVRRSGPHGSTRRRPPRPSPTWQAKPDRLHEEPHPAIAETWRP